jgi:hypothetical protein
MIPIIFLIATILYAILQVGICIALIVRWRKMSKIEKIILDEDLDTFCEGKNDDLEL